MPPPTIAAPPPRPLVIWRITDGKPGHENQSRGLANALYRLVPTTVTDKMALPPTSALRSWMTGRPEICPSNAPPDLVLCAGHATHLTALAARRWKGGRIVVLMRPSLPLRWFDLCITPEHDAVHGPNVIPTRGVLNDIVASTDKDPAIGLILLGGPSRHGHWDSDAICHQIAAIVARDPRRWVVASSRRTPATTLLAVERLSLDQTEIIPWQQTAPGWLRQQLTTASVAWVSEDSVSMLYEVMSSGTALGLIRLPPMRPTRVRSGIQQLCKKGQFVYADEWLSGREMPGVGQPLQEAQRCAELILQRWFA